MILKIGEPDRIRLEGALCLLAVALGFAARLVLIHTRSLWFDEILTLTVARQSITGIVDSVSRESNAPLHYFLAKVMLEPLGPTPSKYDWIVRYLSFAASLLHLPLLARTAARLGAARAGRLAQAVFATSALAVYYGSEARAYALGSLFVLCAFDQALALVARPSARNGVGLALAATLAILAHHSSVFPLLALAWLFRRGGRSAKAFLGAMLTASALLVPWLLVAIHQPRGAVGWGRLIGRGEAVRRLMVNLMLGVDAEGSRLPTALVVVAGLVALAILTKIRRSPTAAEPLGVVALGLLGLAAASVVRPEVLVPPRILVPFLPFMALLVGLTGPALVLIVGVVSCGWLIREIPRWTALQTADRLVTVLAPYVAQGWHVCAVGMHGPELDYKLRLLQPSATVLFFPADVRRHQGWYEDDEPGTQALGVEARAMVMSSDPTIFVLPSSYAARATLALREALTRRGARVVGWYEVVLEDGRQARLAELVASSPSK